MPVETVIKSRQDEYYQRLSQAGQRSYCTGFILFLLEALRDALAIAISDRPDAKTEMSVNVSAETSVESRLKTPELILKILSEEPSLTLSEVAERIGKSARTVERAASALVKVGRLRFVGPRKGGFWEVLDSGSQQ